jgi:hypothetical protein
VTRKVAIKKYQKGNNTRQSGGKESGGRKSCEKIREKMEARIMAIENAVK